VSSETRARTEGEARLRFIRGVLWTVASLATGTLVWAVPQTIRSLPDVSSGFWAMAIAALVVDTPLFGARRREDLRVRSTLSVCFTFAIFVLWGAAPAIVVQAVAGAVTVIGQRYQARAGIYFVARLVLAAAAAELAVDIVVSRPITEIGAGLDGGDLLAFTLLGAVWFTVSYGLLAVARAAISPLGLRQATAEVRSDLFGTSASVLVVSPLLTTIPGWWKAIMVVPLIIWNRLSREQLRHEARLSREPVSGLLNREGLAIGMRELMALDPVEPAGPRPFGIVVVSADALSAINRSLGRELYERVVAKFSAQLVAAYGQDRVGRVSGEGMVVLVPDLTEDEAASRAEEVARLLSETVEVDEIPFTLDPTAGVALSPQHGRDLSTLLMKAELAVDQARRHNQRAALYVREAAEVVRRRIALLREARTVLSDPRRHSELSVLYQPQVNLTTGGLSGVEALVRWNHPEWGPIPTDELIEAIEASDVMHLLTRHMLQTVATQVREWDERGRRIRAAINVSVQDLHEPGFVEEIEDTVRSHGIAPDQLTIEITERMLMRDAPLVQQVCARLVRIGVGLSLDDFGTGHASLQQLRRLPLSEVKIDQSYVRGIIDNPADLAIVRSVHELAGALGVEVVAEGVEDRRISDCLATMAGTIGQGYYFGRPMSAGDLEAWRASR
jgi:diguanylate cyclase (GGDEF)-like protein